MLAPDPLQRLHTFGFLALNYQKLSATVEALLASESRSFDRKLRWLKTRTMKQDLDSWALKTLYPTTMRYALFIAIYSQFEFYLHETCKELEHKHIVKVCDLRDKGITRANSYLKKVIGIDAPFSQQSWQNLTDLNTIRNWIVHGGGMVGQKDNVGAITRVNEWAPLEIKDSQIILSKPFNASVSKMLHGAAKELFERLMLVGWK